MADFASTNKNASFEAWFEQLCFMAEINGENAGDKNDWEGIYQAGTPVDSAYYDAFGGDDD
ncbi:hypothetical protein JQ760_028515 (plasmid) [Klebsiella pneumoniae]|uniref:hypothetical protein n=1 Tax=Klebsiella pneumoniae TaxID=573 RepID=UPI001FAC7CA6|nr:hypothetical protein [Klebsiella pneumoniae]MCI8108393.1 hypothetical protein [Klebsiella pneumoniae]